MTKTQTIKEVSLRLLQPYTISEECPYLSDDQRELSRLDLEGRSAWMAEWLMLANDRQVGSRAKVSSSWL